MRIVLIGPAHPLRGGIAQYNTSLAQAFLSGGDDVLVISYARQYPGIFFPGKTQEDQEGEAYRVAAEHLVDSINPFNWPRVAARIAAFEPDLVLFQWWQPFFGPAFLGISRSLRKYCRVPVLFVCHNLLSHESRSFPLRLTIERFMARAGFRGADGFLVHADQLQNSLGLYAPGKPSTKIFHPLYDFFAAWDKPFKREDSQVLNILFFGKIRRYKGLEILIEALGLLGPEISFRAVFAGECYLPMDGFRQRISDLKLDDRISWIDRYIPNEEIPEIFRSADVVVLPYLSASQSGVIPIAYQFEVPVIVSDVGGLSEVVRDGETGFLVEPGNPAELAEVITRFYNFQAREQMKEAICLFRKMFTWAKVVERIKELHRDIISQGFGRQ